jgi:Fur family ferric uptake transcriptional regulator
MMLRLIYYCKFVAIYDMIAIMSEAIEQLEIALKAHGFSMTKPRQVVFSALQNEEPQTMHELVARCPQTDRASIYRTVALFEQLGIVQRLQIGWKYKLELTGDFIHHHHHLSCLHCGKVIALPKDDDLEKRLHALAAAQKFEPQDHQLEIRGLCYNCQLSRLQ